MQGFCNGRNKGTRATGKPKIDVGDWAGEGYCRRREGWGVPEMATGRCKKHGGASLKGAAHPQAKDLRYSKYVPAHLAEDYEASLERDDQLNLDRQVAAIDARLAELMREMPEGAGPDLWRLASETFDAFEGAARRGQREAARHASAELRTILTGGAEYAASWNEVKELMDLRRKLVRAEALRRTAIADSVTRARLANLVIFLSEGIQRAINENVSNRRERRRALTQISSFILGLSQRAGRELGT